MTEVQGLRVRPGDTAPDFSLPSTAGEDVILSGLVLA
jgi:peroxiredoxin